MSVSKLMRFLLIPLYRPSEGLSRLLTEQFALGYGLLSLAIVGALYTVTVFAGFLNGFGAVVTRMVRKSDPIHSNTGRFPTLMLSTSSVFSLLCAPLPKSK
jgi:hypothetical protein